MAEQELTMDEQGLFNFFIQRIEKSNEDTSVETNNELARQMVKFTLSLIEANKETKEEEKQYHSPQEQFSSILEWLYTHDNGFDSVTKWRQAFINFLRDTLV